MRSDLQHNPPIICFALERFAQEGIALTTRATGLACLTHTPLSKCQERQSFLLHRELAAVPSTVVLIR